MLFLAFNGLHPPALIDPVREGSQSRDFDVHSTLSSDRFTWVIVEHQCKAVDQKRLEASGRLFFQELT